MTKPILLWMTSRSRSSMVSAIFAAHGIFWGSKQVQSAGYDTYENQEIKKIQKKYWGVPVMKPISIDKIANFQTDLSNIIPDNRTWLMKTGIEYFHAYENLNPFNIYITRNPEDTAKSLCDKRQNAKYEDALEIIKWRFNYMDEIANKYGGVFVSTDLIISGDFTEIKEAIEYCGITFDEEATRSAIKK